MTDGTDSDRTATAAGVTATYRETETERVLEFALESHASSSSDAGTAPAAGRTAIIAQNREGYAMLAVRLNGVERERYYGFEMAIDHVAELLGVPARELPIPDAAADMGM